MHSTQLLLKQKQNKTLIVFKATLAASSFAQLVVAYQRQKINLDKGFNLTSINDLYKPGQVQAATDQLGSQRGLNFSDPLSRVLKDLFCERVRLMYQPRNMTCIGM
jgi:hypothetical protein